MKTYNINTDQELIIKLKKGSAEAFEQLYNLYSKKLYHFGIKYLKSEEEAEGLVQNVFEKVWEKRENLDAELSFKSYLFTIAFNLIRRFFNKKTHLHKYIESTVGSNEIDLNTTQQIEYHSTVEYLNSLINKLPAKRKKIFIKSRLEQLPIKEIARQMEISPKTVENQLFSAIKFIKENWKGDKPAMLLFISIYLS